MERLTLRQTTEPMGCCYMNERLDLTPLKNAVNRLAEGLTRYAKDVTDTQIRDGLIQRFEFSPT